MPRRPGPMPEPVAPNLPTVTFARDHPPAYVAAQVRSGAWIRVRHGAYLPAPTDPDVYDQRRRLALARIVAMKEQLACPFVLSHESAAMLWGLPLLAPPLRTHIIQGWSPKRSVGADLVRHAHELPAEHRTTRLGHAVTTLERAVADCAMALDPREALMVADAALHVGADRRRCLDILDGMAGRRGVVVAREVLALADDGAESPGESSARFILLRAGLPAPETQIEIRTDLGVFWADMGWREWRALAEYDGRAKYEANGSASEAVVQEKRRQGAIEESGWRVLRITKEDIRVPASLLRRIARLVPPGALDGLRTRRMLNGSRSTSEAGPARRGGVESGEIAPHS